jgi:aminoglycoside 6'-N-acetyltransferase
MMMGDLWGSRVRLRPLTMADRVPLTELLQNPGVAPWWGAYDLDRVSADFYDDPSVTALAIEVDGQLVGLVDFYEELEPDYRHAALDIAVGDAFRRQGFGGDALRTLISYLVGQRGHHRLTIDPAAANLEAIAFYESLGFRRVGTMRCYERGTDGRWHDGLLMELVDCQRVPT